MIFRKLIPCLVFLASSFASATDPIEVIGMTSTPDCGQMTHEVNLDPSDSSVQCLRVYFQDFAISSNGTSEVQRNCHMSAKLRIPANTQFRASEAVAEGVYRMDGLAYGGLNLSYELKATQALGEWFKGFRPFTASDFNFTTKVESQSFTTCYPYETEVELTSDLHAYIDQRDGGHSLVSLDETGKRLSWNWKLKPCQLDLFASPFITYYQAPNGRQYRALLKISGSRGTYDSDAGFTGQLFNIRRSADGMVAEGEWQASGVRGTFRFQIVDARTGRFEGRWSDSFGRNGGWRGEYE